MESTEIWVGDEEDLAGSKGLSLAGVDAPMPRVFESVRPYLERVLA
ncbi:hypothetical protein GCM10009610_69630 [Pseudonocardia xinjiangensis]